MGNSKHKQLVFTVKDRCRVCYTCVRECPVKAIKIINGQAEVLAERCIGCGNCVKICSQEAKVYLRLTDSVFQFLESEEKVIAIIAPSFPAEFIEIPDHRVLVGMLRKLGFSIVCEVGFGADIVALEYKEMMENTEIESVISSDCPAISYYVEHYYPHLSHRLARIASPMVAMTRVVRKKYGSDSKVVFIGPCVAKKAESDELDSVITYTELREMFKKTNITADNITPSDFDPPYAGKGAIFPISRGLLYNMDFKEDICEGNIIVAEGRIGFRDVIDEFDKGILSNAHLELLCCEGCIMGPGTSKGGKRYARRTIVSRYVKQKLQNLDINKWKKEVEEFRNIDLSQTFEPKDRRIQKPFDSQVNEVLFSMGKNKPEDYLNCGACGYDTCVEHSIAIVQGLAENEMCLPFAIDKLHASNKELNKTNIELASARQALKQSEKLANMGQLSAGIAHELNNPLGVITLYSNILKDQVPENEQIRKDLELIVEQADRCKYIVGGLLNFARKNQVRYEMVNIVEFTKNSIQSIIKPDNVIIDFKAESDEINIMIDIQQMNQVLTNLEKNAVEAMPDGGLLKIEIKEKLNDIEIKVSDTGLGISKENMNKIFTPFFTTKKPGKGTGLGLPLIYGIVKMHKGRITVESNADKRNGPTGTTFKIILPTVHEKIIIEN